MDQSAPVEAAKPKVTRASIAGLGIALVAFAAAMFSPWVERAMKPEPRPIEEVAAGIAGRVKDRLAAKVKGEEYVVPARKRPQWPLWYTGIVVGAGVIAVAIGVIGLASHHDARLNGAVVAVAISAIIFQYAMLFAVSVSVIALVMLFYYWVFGPFA